MLGRAPRYHPPCSQSCKQNYCKHIWKRLMERKPRCTIPHKIMGSSCMRKQWTPGHFSIFSVWPGEKGYSELKLFELPTKCTAETHSQVCSMLYTGYFWCLDLENDSLWISACVSVSHVVLFFSITRQHIVFVSTRAEQSK